LIVTTAAAAAALMKQMILPLVDLRSYIDYDEQITSLPIRRRNTTIQSFLEVVAESGGKFWAKKILLFSFIYVLRFPVAKFLTSFPSIRLFFALSTFYIIVW